MNDTTPVVVGVGRVTDRGADSGGPGISLRDIMAEATRRAAADASARTFPLDADGILGAVEAVACPGTFFTGTADGVTRRAGMPQVYPNLPASVAKAAGCTGVSDDSFFYTIASGSSPQYFINHFAEKISRGEREVVLVVGGEVLMTTRKMGAMGRAMNPEHADEVHAMLADWTDDTGAPPPNMIAVEEEVLQAMGAAPIEAAHGLGAPIATYPIFEQASSPASSSHHGSLPNSPPSSRSPQFLSPGAASGARPLAGGAQRLRGEDLRGHDGGCGAAGECRARLVPGAAERGGDQDPQRRQPVHRLPLHQEDELHAL